MIPKLSILFPYTYVLTGLVLGTFHYIKVFIFLQRRVNVQLT